MSDAVLEARKLLLATPVNDKEWDVTVAPQVLKLAKSTLPNLSHGFGTGLFMITAGFWALSASAFSKGLDDDLDPAKFFRSFNLFCFPLLIALDVASASSACDSLVISLNAKRMHGILEQQMDVDIEHKLQILERALALQNAGQGLGFVVLGVVVDRKTLSRIFWVVMGTLGTIGPIIVALRPEADYSSTHESCSLSAQQRNAIRATASAVLGANSTCSFENVTLGYIMGVF